MYRITANVLNIPAFKFKGSRYLVARRDDDGGLWYYGIYEDSKKAREAAQKIRNGVVLMVEEN